MSLVLFYDIEGLNIDSQGFNWKNRLIFTNGNKPDENVAIAAVKVPTYSSSADNALFKREEEALRVIIVFLACYRLQNHKMLPKLAKGNMTGIGIEDSTDLLNHPDVRAKETTRKTNYGKISTQDTMAYIAATMPLFEKVMKIIDERKKGHSVDVALVMYYNSHMSIESMEVIVDLVTCLEALFSEDNRELRYKIAFRTAIFTRDNPSERRKLFDWMKGIYDLRSSFVHGGDVSLTPAYFGHNKMLYETVEISLKKYIELASNGMTQDQIIRRIDDVAFGINY